MAGVIHQYTLPVPPDADDKTIARLRAKAIIRWKQSAQRMTGAKISDDLILSVELTGLMLPFGANRAWIVRGELPPPPVLIQ